MYNRLIKRSLMVSMLVLSVTSSAISMEGVNSSKSYENISVFVMDFDVKLYNDEETIIEKQKLNYFDPLIVLSESVNTKGRIKVKLQNGIEGWIEEKYTSYVSKDWVKKQFNEEYFCYILSNQKMSLAEKKNNVAIGYEYKNKDYKINFGIISNYLGYALIVQQYEDGIIRCIDAGEEKRLNWTKEFTCRNYKINYTITTDDPEGWIIEAFDFVKLNELELKKSYSFSTTYKPSVSLEKRLIQRKILFSSLQSLK